MVFLLKIAKIQRVALGAVSSKKILFCTVIYNAFFSSKEARSYHLSLTCSKFPFFQSAKEREPVPCNFVTARSRI